MASWLDIANSSAYTSLPPAERVAAKEAYFHAAIAPDVPENMADAARTDFMTRNQAQDYHGVDPQIAVKANAVKSAVATGTLSRDQGLRILQTPEAGIALPGAEWFIDSTHTLPERELGFSEAFHASGLSGLHRAGAAAARVAADVTNSGEDDPLRQLAQHETQRAEETAPDPAASPTIGSHLGEFAAGTGIFPAELATLPAQVAYQVKDAGGTPLQVAAASTIATAGAVAGFVLPGVGSKLAAPLARAGAGLVERGAIRAVGGAGATVAGDVATKVATNAVVPEAAQQPITPEDELPAAGMGALFGLPSTRRVPIQERSWGGARGSLKSVSPTEVITPSGNTVNRELWNKTSSEDRAKWFREPDFSEPAKKPEPPEPTPRYPEDARISDLLTDIPQVKTPEVRSILEKELETLQNTRAKRIQDLSTAKDYDLLADAAGKREDFKSRAEYLAKAKSLRGESVAQPEVEKGLTPYNYEEPESGFAVDSQGRVRGTVSDAVPESEIPGTVEPVKALTGPPTREALPAPSGYSVDEFEQASPGNPAPRKGLYSNPTLDNLGLTPDVLRAARYHPPDALTATEEETLLKHSGLQAEELPDSELLSHLVDFAARDPAALDRIAKEHPNDQDFYRAALTEAFKGDKGSSPDTGETGNLQPPNPLAPPLPPSLERDL